MLVVLDLLDQVRAGFLTAVLVLPAAASWPRVRHFCRSSETSSLTSQNTSARGSRTKIATQNSAAGLQNKHSVVDSHSYTPFQKTSARSDNHTRAFGRKHRVAPIVKNRDQFV